jgi:putative ABC transport system substrate-binding protein
VENANGIPEACRAVIARGAQAIWIGSDITVSGAASVVLEAARQARIPVFSILPGKPDRGTLFDVGVDYFVVGKQTGYQAADVLRGADLTPMAIRDVLEIVPKQLTVNLQVLKGLKDSWSVPPTLLPTFDIVVDERGIHKRSSTAH